MPVCAISTPTPHKISLSESVVNIFIWVSIFSPNRWWTILLLSHRCSVLLIIYILWWFMICSSFHPSVKSCTQFNCKTWFIVNQSCMRSIVEKHLQTNLIVTIAYYFCGGYYTMDCFYLLPCIVTSKRSYWTVSFMTLLPNIIHIYISHTPYTAK